MSTPKELLPPEPSPAGVEPPVGLTLRFYLVEKLLPGQLQLLEPVGERALIEALGRYQFAVEAVPNVVPPLDRREGAVDRNEQLKARGIMLSPEQSALFTDETLTTVSHETTSKVKSNWKPQAAAIIIATIALLTQVLEVIR